MDEVEYRTIMSRTKQLVWVKQFLQILNFHDIQQMKIYCDNQVALHIISNPMFHKKTKHTEVDNHFIREMLSTKICPKFIKFNDQLEKMQ